MESFKIRIWVHIYQHRQCWNESRYRGICTIKYHFCFTFYILMYYTPEKAMAPHSSTLAWKIPWMEEPGRLQSMGSLRVRHNWVTSFSLSLFTFMHWRRKWQPTPVFLPGEFHGQSSLVGYSPWGHKESETTERPSPAWWDILAAYLVFTYKQNFWSQIMIDCVWGRSIQTAY